MNEAPLRLSAVVCTRNRLDYLKGCVTSLLRQSAAPDRYEIIVVDNGSEDGTDAYLDELDVTTHRFTRLHERRPGLARARNAALAHVRGEIVAFLDDDAVAREDWIARVIHAFDRGGSAFGVLSGKTAPIWNAPRPAWLSDRGLGALAIVDWSPYPRFLEEGQFLVGANMAFRTRLLRAIGGFPERLGRVGERLLSGEETFVASRLAQQGAGVFYDPTVVVDHHVQAERTRRSWLLRRAYWQGVSDVIGASPPDRRSAVARAADLTLGMAGSSARLLYSLATPDPARRFDEIMDAARRVGAVAALLGVGRQEPARDPRSFSRASSPR